MRPYEATFTMAAADRNGICEAQTPGGAGNLTINGALATGGVATLDVPRHISIYAAGNESGVTFTITGTNRYGDTITETMSGPNATTVKGSKNFLTVTQIAVDGGTSGNVEVGSADELDTPIVALDHYAGNVSYFVTLSSSASLTYEFKYTASNIYAHGFVEDDAVFFTDIGPKTMNSNNASVGQMRGCRLEITNFSAGSVTLTVLTSKM